MQIHVSFYRISIWLMTLKLQKHKNIITPVELQSIDLQVQLSMPTDPISKQVNTK